MKQTQGSDGWQNSQAISHVMVVNWQLPVLGLKVETAFSLERESDGQTSSVYCSVFPPLGFPVDAAVGGGGWFH